LILVKEAQLLYSRAPEFKPLNGNLRVWRGALPSRTPFSDSKFEVEVVIPEEFPKVPPVVKVITPLEHPNVARSTGRINLNILRKWSSNYHVYQVINNIKGLFARIPPKSVNQVTAEDMKDKNLIKKLESEVLSLKEEINKLKLELDAKDKEIAELKERISTYEIHPIEEKESPSSLPEAQELVNLEGEKIALNELLNELERKFENGDVSLSEFSKVYKRYKKELFLVNKKISSLSS